MRQLGIVCAIWSFAFVLKLITVAFGRSLYYIENQSIGATQYGTACLLACCDFLTIVVPMYCIVEDSFVNLMTGKFLDYANGYVPMDGDSDDSIMPLPSKLDLR